MPKNVRSLFQFLAVFSLVLAACGAPIAPAPVSLTQLALTADGTMYSFTQGQTMYYILVVDMARIKQLIDTAGSNLTWYISQGGALGIPLLVAAGPTTVVVSGSVLVTAAMYQTPTGIVILSQLGQLTNTTQSMTENTNTVRFEKSQTVVDGWDLVIVGPNGNIIARFPSKPIDQALAREIEFVAEQEHSTVVRCGGNGCTTPQATETCISEKDREKYYTLLAIDETLAVFFLDEIHRIGQRAYDSTTPFIDKWDTKWKQESDGLYKKWVDEGCYFYPNGGSPFMDYKVARTKNIGNKTIAEWAYEQGLTLNSSPEIVWETISGLIASWK